MNRTDSFLQLIRAGLWEKTEGDLPAVSDATWLKVLELAKEQTVPGLLSAGIRRYNAEPPSEVSLQLMQEEAQMELRNAKMDAFIAKLFTLLQKDNIQAVLIKGQSIARYYEQPERRCPGDVDLVLTPENYEKAKTLMTPKARSCGPEDRFLLHYGLFFGGIELELHGTLRSRLSSRIDRFIDGLCKDVFDKSRFQIQGIAGSDIPSPVPDDYLILLFLHILQHFFQEGIGLRQICDWCRLLWAGKGEFDIALLEERLKNLGLMSEWHAFAALAVGYLGLPKDAMPLYEEGYEIKAARILRYIFNTGNFGQNRDLAGMRRLPFFFKKTALFLRKAGDFFKYRLMIFPADGTRFMFHTTLVSIRHSATELSGRG